MQNVSIVLPVYNGALYIADAIQSVQNQSYTAWKLVIVDDGSTDETESVVQMFLQADNRIQYCKHAHNRGLQRALTTGLNESNLTYIARIDADDIWNDKEKLAVQIALLEADTACVLVGTGSILVDTRCKEITRYLLPTHDDDIRARILAKNCFTHSSVVFRRSAIDTVGGYSNDPRVRHVEDHELWLRMGTIGTIENIPAYSVTLTIRNTSITSGHRVVQAKHLLYLCRTYKNMYPHWVSGYCVGVVRLVFFSLLSLIPMPFRMLYALQSLFRRM